MNQPDPAETFLVEAEDLLNQVEDTLLEIERRPDDAEAVHQLFRAFHTLKGSGAMFGFSAVSSLAHHVETVLDKLRDGSIAISPELVGVVLSARDELKAILADTAGASATPSARALELVQVLQGYLPANGASSRSQTSPRAAAPDATSEAPLATHRIQFHPAPDIAASGLDPMVLLNELRSLGTCRIAVNTAAIPVLDELDPERCHLGWSVELRTRHELNRVRDVFVFVEDTSELRIETAAEAAADDSPAAKRPAAPAEPSPDRADGHVRGPRVTSAVGGMVRVPAAKLDHLVNLVGELVINQSRLQQVAARVDAADLLGPVESLERLVADLRDSVLGIRMMPIGSTFARFKRLVHDLSLELGKKVELVTEGAETEVDKTVLDQLGDPLVHLIRNCIDHGICPPDARRRAAGKPETGTVRLTASHEGSHVVVEIADDGRGIDVDAVRRKAAEKGLISPDAVLSEKEVFDLIFLPGFSTAKAVTNVSGRGVGMDVVKRQIESLRGTIHTSSTPGQGTRIRLSLPLTLAIIDGLLVEIADEQFIIPLSTVTENVEVDTSRNGKLCGQGAVAVRGELVPYVCLRELFDMPGKRPALEKVVLVTHGTERVGLSVDRVLGKHQTVIQSLGRFYRNIRITSGATILGDGRVALILDVAGLLQTVAAQQPRATASSFSQPAAARGKNLPSS